MMEITIWIEEDWAGICRNDGVDQLVVAWYLQRQGTKCLLGSDLFDCLLDKLLNIPRTIWCGNEHREQRGQFLGAVKKVAIDDAWDVALFIGMPNGVEQAAALNLGAEITSVFVITKDEHEIVMVA